MWKSLQVDTLHSGEYIGDEVDEAEERRARRAVALSFLSNMYALIISEHFTWLQCILGEPSPASRASVTASELLSGVLSRCAYGGDCWVFAQPCCDYAVCC